MGEITEIVELYIEEADLLEPKLDEMALKLTENIQNQLYYGHGRITGNLRDSVQNDYQVDGLNGTVRAYTGDSAPYGIWVNEGHHSWGGYHFMEAGLEETVALYK